MDIFNGSIVFEDHGNGTISFNSTIEPIVASNRTLQDVIDEYALANYGQYYNINFPLTLVICLIGLVTNAFNIVVFTRKHMMNSANFLLVVLSLADISMILTQLAYPVHHLMNFRYIFNYHFTRFYIALIFFENVSIMICNWCVVAIGAFRFLAVQWPLKAPVMCSMHRAKKVVIAIAVASLVISAPIFGILSYDETQFRNETLYYKYFSNFAFDNPEVLFTFWVSLSMVAFVPCVISVVLTFLLIRSLIQLKSKRKQSFSNTQKSKMSSQDSQNFRITAMLTVLLLLFILNNLPDSTLILAAVVTDGNENAHKASREATDVVRMFSMVNNSFSFFIYYLMGVNFRSTFKQLFSRDGVESKTESVNSASTTASRQSIENTNISLPETTATFNETPHSTLTVNTIV